MKFSKLAVRKWGEMERHNCECVGRGTIFSAVKKCVWAKMQNFKKSTVIFVTLLKI